MVETNIIEQGTTLMLYGMGTVFVFLTLLVFATSLMSKVVSKFSSPEVIESQAAGNAGASARNTSVDKNIITAIENAIAAHRKR